MHHAQRCFLASGCSTYLRVRLRAPRIENPTGHGTSPPSPCNPVRYAGLSPIVLLDVAQLRLRRPIRDNPSGYLRFATLATKPGEKCELGRSHPETREIYGLVTIPFNKCQHVQAGRLHHKDSGSVLWCSRLGCTSIC